MTAELFWQMFWETADPMYYLLYKEAKWQEDNPAEMQKSA